MTRRPTAPISSRLVAFTAITVVLWSAGALAQTPTTTPVPPPQAAVPTDQATRPATTTFFGDTGLWYVPTAEVLARGRWSASAYRRGTNYIQGYTNVGDVATTFAYGLGDRAELFGSFLVVTRIDRDTQPLFFNDVKVGGIVERYPGVTTRWSGNNLGDLFLGAKVSLLSERTGHPVAVAVRGMVKLPTGDVDAGVSTGRTDTMFDVITSKEVARAVEISGFGGYEFRGNAEGFDLPAGAFRWGTGAAFPTRFSLRGFAELGGVLPSSASALITSAALQGPDGSRPPSASNTEKLTRLTFGLTYQARGGFFIGAGLSRNLPSERRDPSRASEGSFTDYTDWQLRFGYHPGQRARAIPAAPQMAQAAPAAAVVPAVQPPPVAPTPPPTPTPAPPAPVSVPVAAPRAYAFQDVYFDYDRSTLRPDALLVLDGAASAMRADAALTLTIEGHTCDIGTSEYNLALGERRANAVRSHLISRGVDPSRVRAVSFGEERPAFDNAREDTRRMNRRAVVVAVAR